MKHLSLSNKENHKRVKKTQTKKVTVTQCSLCVLIWRGLGNWMVQNGMLHCADPIIHSKALDELYNRLYSCHFPCTIHQLTMPEKTPRILKNKIT